MDTLRGHPIELRDGEWYYVDTGEPTATTWRDRPCGHCGLPNRDDGHDACLGELPGVVNACCGHGDPRDAYLQFKGGWTMKPNPYTYREDGREVPAINRREWWQLAGSTSAITTGLFASVVLAGWFSAYQDAIPHEAKELASIGAAAILVAGALICGVIIVMYFAVVAFCMASDLWDVIVDTHRTWKANQSGD